METKREEKAVDAILMSRSMQLQHNYFIMGVNIAAIGYAVQSVKDVPYSLNLIYLLISLICWGISLFLGHLVSTGYIDSISKAGLIMALPLESKERGEVVKETKWKTYFIKKLSNFQFFFLLLGILMYLLWNYKLILLNK